MNDIKKYVLEVVDEIERSLSCATLDDISGRVFLSKYHLDRIFKTATGKSVMEYVRSRRLAASLDDLVNTNWRILDIAGKYGFAYETSYIRAFKREFGLSPTQFRKQPVALNITSKITESSLHLILGGLVFRPFSVFRPAFRLAGILTRLSIDASRFDHAAANLAKDFFYNQRRRILHALNPAVYIGLSSWDEYDQGYSRYLSAVQVDEKSIIPADMLVVGIPAARYAVFRYIGSFHPVHLTNEHIRHIWYFIEYTWLAERSLSRKDVYSFEYVDSSLAREDYCELDLYVQLKE